MREVPIARIERPCITLEAELVIVSADPRTGETRPLTDDERAAFELVR